MQRLFTFIWIVVFMFAGCSARELAVEDIQPGMSQDEVKLAWGNPRIIKNWKNTCCREKGEESWYYFNTSVQPPKPTKMVIFTDNEVKKALKYKNL